jgi:hypothetical protein
MLPPLPRCSSRAYSSLISPGRISLPRKGCRVGLHIVLFEACSAFTRVAACTLARSPIRDPLPEGFRHFVASMPAPVASGWSESPGGACTHWKAPPCHGAHPTRSFAPNLPQWTHCTDGWCKRFRALDAANYCVLCRAPVLNRPSDSREVCVAQSSMGRAMCSRNNQLPY